MVLSFLLTQSIYGMRDKEVRLYSPKSNTRMKKIFLCSSFADVAPLLPESVPTSLSGKTVAFIPTASIHEEYTQYVEDGKNALVSLGLVVRELEITQCEKKEIVKVLNDCDCIYISGGNTFYLLQELRKTGVDELIKQHIFTGKLYIGESAGAMVTAPNIEYVCMMDDPNEGKELTNFEALNVVDFSTVPHL